MKQKGDKAIESIAFPYFIHNGYFRKLVDMRSAIFRLNLYSIRIDGKNFMSDPSPPLF